MGIFSNFFDVALKDIQKLARKYIPKNGTLSFISKENSDIFNQLDVFVFRGKKNLK